MATFGPIAVGESSISVANAGNRHLTLVNPSPYPVYLMYTPQGVTPLRTAYVGHGLRLNGNCCEYKTDSPGSWTAISAYAGGQISGDAE